jgi:hypothetical protein
LDGGRHLNRLKVLDETVLAAFAAERTCLDQSPDTLLEEQRSSLGLLHEQMLQGIERGITADEGFDKVQR